VPLSVFSQPVQDWFRAAFESPTSAQAQAWPAISSGEHVLLSAPTGSGKTLAAFLWALDRLSSHPLARADRYTRIVYVSPLKALAYDIERNLRAPLRGIGADLSVAIRTGDTPQRERAAMARNPPDILITTPESLYLILTSQAREMLRGVEALIVDEIHAVAATKRGAHLALTIERLSAQTRGAFGKDPQRIGLSATQNPLAEIASFLVGPRRSARIIDVGASKPLDLKIHIPVESMAHPEGNAPADPLEPVAGGEATRRSIWPAIYPELLELIRSHTSTIVFVNNRRSAERLALRLNELAGADGEPALIARAHHGSLAREERMLVEEQLKAGQIPCIIATSSLELGIDMGAVDLVLQVESPKSVAAGLQRIGRSGHGVGEVSKGRIFPKFRADLLECAVLARRMREGAIEPTVVPRNPLDVLAQQIVAMAASLPQGGELPVEELYELVQGTYSYAELPRTQLENVLDMLDGRYPSSEFSELRPRIVWDRLAGSIRARKGARQLAITNAGTIPDRGLYLVTLPDGRRVGELDEEMVYEARPGQTFLLGASSWRIEEIGRDRVIVTPAPGAPGAVPFWKGDGVGRPKQLGEAIGAFARQAVDQSPQALMRDYDLEERAARNLLEFLAEQQLATRVIPSDRTVVIERFRDEIGDWRLCVLSPYGERIHAAWSLAITARVRDELGLEADAISSDDGIILHLPDADEPPGSEIVLIEPDELEDRVIGELAHSALFGARFRENAGRALLIPRAYPGRRTPLWQQRLKAQSLLEVAKRYGEFPIVLETYRECLQDVLDLGGLRELLGKLHRRELSLVEVETQTASPFACSLLFDYVANYMYEGDTPNAERKAAALSLDRELLRELLGQEELRELIDIQALENVAEDLQHTSQRTRAATADELHDVLRRVGDLTVAEASARVLDGLDGVALLATLERQRRAVRVRIAGEERLIDAADAGLYRDALGAVPPGGLPQAFLVDVPGALVALMRRYAATHAPFTTVEPRQRYGLDPTPALRELERAGELVRGELHPHGVSGEREWCDPDVLRRLRRASLAALRKEIEPADQRAFAAFLPAWHGIDRHAGSGAGADRLREVLVALQGVALTPETWEREVLPRRIGGYSPAWMDELCASGEVVWVGAGALGRSTGRVALYFREDAALIGPPWRKPQQPALEGERPHELVRDRLRAGPCFFTDLIADLDLAAQELQCALWDLAFAGEVTNDAFSPLRAPRLTVASPARHGAHGTSRSRFAARRHGPRAAHVQGRWSLTDPLFAGQPADPSLRRRAIAELLLERHGILTRELVLAEGLPGGFSAIYPELCQLETLGVARRGYFIEGLGGAQFALPAAVERLRSQRAVQEAPALVLGASDPAQPYGAALPWPRRSGQERRLTRSPGASVVLVGADPVLYLERSGRNLLLLLRPDDDRLRPALAALADYARAGHLKRIALEKINGETIIGTRFEALLAEVGFHPGPRRLTLSA
jgi:ATP-dependent Lhr-like helicase